MGLLKETYKKLNMGLLDRVPIYGIIQGITRASTQLDKGADCKSVSSGFDSHLAL